MGLFDMLKGKKDAVDRSMAHHETMAYHETMAHHETPESNGNPAKTDESGFAPFYQAIADKLDEIVPEEWEEIVMYAEAFSGMATANFYYRKPKDEKYLSGGKIPDHYGVDTTIYFGLVQDLIGSVKNLKKEFTEQNQREWKSLTFYLNNDFKFRVEYSYEIDEDVDSYDRQIYWAYETLGIEPESGHAKTVLDQYLERKK